MGVILVPYHLDEELLEFDLDWPAEHELVDVVAGDGDEDTWPRLAAIYERVAELVASGSARSVVVSGDCTTSAGVIAGLQRRGLDPGVVWIDAHGDLQTRQTTSSGYIGGMALSAALGREPRLAKTVGFRPVSPSRTMLVGARDLEDTEQKWLSNSQVTVASTPEVGLLPDGPLYLHIDLDVCDPGEIEDLRYPASVGFSFATLLTSVAQICAQGDIAGIGIAATWRHGGAAGARHRVQLRRLMEVALSS